ncbi:ARS binding protein 2 [Macrophomina phaseolina MS6]|uniref:ARS binding protein 2 n=1 Tax=Macrophomina phaseolina (strain MS6) TaxID=1126212 RepID=K2RM71_MACPH|nr:ARS binding protein 2 [Macrophomina phaseolina MS6]
MDFNTNGSHLSPHNHQYPQQQGSPGPAYSQYSPAIDPHLASTPGGQRHFHHSTMPGSSPGFNASPRYSASPGHQQPSNYVPSDRSLPSTESVSAENIDEIYAAFVLYCNPYFPPQYDTTELKKVFKKPPMSDNKTFDPYNLFELLKKLEKGEIKTWIQLALDLGVEPPDVEKGQSTQKVQQYAVRLKRWMRAMHIDAFFDFLQGKSHSYYTNIPPPNDPFPPGGRDGVPLEEDLAIRGLDPAFKPKRGRKKAEDLEDDEHGTPPPKRPQLDTSFTAYNSNNHPQSGYPNSAMPMSAHPDNFVNDPWTAASMGTPNTNQRGLTPNSALNTASNSHLRWQVDSHQNPSTPHPLSAVSPMAERPPDSAFDEPLSAITPGSRKPRRRHGPAVSSAWPSSGSGSSGKLRGRPPQNRSVRDGPYVTFPANPNTKEQPTVDLTRHSPDPASASVQLLEAAQGQGQGPSGPAPAQGQTFRFPPTPASATQTGTSPIHSRAGQRLSLQVPQHTGGPVHLVTPTVLVNGESNSPDKQENQAGAALEVPKVTREALKRLLAADLLRADLSGRKRLRGHEAKALADAVLTQLSNQNEGAGEEDGMMNQGLANWLGYSSHVGLGSAPVPSGVKKIIVQKYRVSEDGYESPIDEGEDEREGSAALDNGTKIKETFDVNWSLTFGGCTGKFAAKGLMVESKDEDGEGEKEEGNVGGASGQDKGRSLEERVKELETQLKGKDREVQLWRQRVLEAVL